MLEVAIAIETIRDAVAKDLREAISRAEQGRHRGERAAPAKYLLVSEAVAVASKAVERDYKFHIAEFGAWAGEFPAVPLGIVQSGVLITRIEEAFRAALVEKFKPQVEAMVVGQYATDTMATVLATLDDIVEGDLALVPRHLSGPQLKARVDGYREERSPAMLEMLIRHLSSSSELSLALTRRLDIADPPSADIAGRLHRQFEETLDRLVLVVAKEQKLRATASEKEEA